MACITGDETGLLKVVDLTRASLPKVSYQVGVQERNQGVCGIVQGRKERSEWIVGHANGSVTVLRGGVPAEEGGVPTDAKQIEGTLLPSATPTALFFDPDTAQLSTVDCDGHVQTARLDDDEETGETKLVSVGGFEVQAPITVVHFFKTDTHFGGGVFVVIGGRSNEVAVYRVANGRRVWQAKELPHNVLGLREKVFPSAACILGNGELFVATGYLELRRYDLADKKNRRPAMNWSPEWLDSVRFFCAQARGEAEVFLADNTGSVYRVDAVGKKLLAKYRGVSGTPRALSLHPSLPFLAVAGLSRKVHVFDINTSKQVSVLYLKQVMNAVLFLHPDPFLDRYSHDDATEGRTKEDVANEAWFDLKKVHRRKRPAEEIEEEAGDDGEEADPAPEAEEPARKAAGKTAQLLLKAKKRRAARKATAA
ncbi:hypothetical protein DIPPA_34484 [Diplonema papillatum]|nr:hypothetical protein DIPPA_34484 [Diplonema papillatum]